METGSNYLTLFFVFFTLLCFFFYLFQKNPYHILNLARIPIILLFFVVVLGFFIFIEYYMSHQIFKADSSKEMWSNFSKYLIKYGKFIFYFLTISLMGYVVFKMVERGFVLTFQLSFFLTMGLLILLLAILNSYTKQVSFDNPQFELIRNIIMYIPCLITDTIEYLKKDYANTPSTVFIVFIMLLIYVSIFYFIPLYRKQQYKNDGILLINKSLPLNTDVLSITSEELREKIREKRPFYDKWFQTMIEVDERTPRSKIELQKTEDISIDLLVPPDAITLPYYLPKREYFTTLQNVDANIIPWHIFNKRAKEYDLYFEHTTSPEDYNNRMREFMKEHPQILTVFEKAQYLYSTLFASWDAIKSVPTLLMGNREKVPTYSYHYAITTWVYLHQIQSTKLQRIYSFGTRPSLYYDPVDSSLMVILNQGKKNQQILYKTKDILYQRWNFIVMNYRYGTLDLFINNNLIGTYPDVLTRLDNHDILLVGSAENGKIGGYEENVNIGGICNMKYYELPLTVRKIDSIYKTFHNKKIPI